MLLKGLSGTVKKQKLIGQLGVSLLLHFLFYPELLVIYQRKVTEYSKVSGYITTTTIATYKSLHVLK